ncbi:hypothetical protein [Pantoea rwandensis]|uniref:Uncharacterized protein n=1 Tax=Pantoea rwandensis TaxID=1076550 RepID=A0A1X1CMK5_9GAMM|nr:hypothetical protein [Pantoea rwandensis]ORM65560.1 hypothetical protein HA51_25225 [Pantoea rwandensis]
MKIASTMLLSLLLMPLVSEAKSVRIVWSPTLRLSAWLDNVVDGRVKSWCDESVALHFEPQGELKQDAIETFLPQVGQLLKRQCHALNALHWTLIDSSGKAVREGDVTEKNNWRIPPKPKAVIAQADTTPWQRFRINDRCQLRTYWPASGDARFTFDAHPQCDKDDWINGAGTLHQGEVTTTLWFLQGYPLIDLPAGAHDAQVVAANNQRLILASANDAQSWLLLPWDPDHLAWRFHGDVLMKASEAQMRDDNANAQLMADALHRWQIDASASQLNWHRVDDLQLQQRDPTQPAS